MSELERDLREALKRREPPAGFEERMLARVALERERELERAHEAAGRRGWWWQWLGTPGLRLATATTLAVVLVGSATLVGIRRHAEEVRGIQARQQLLLALRITGTKLEFARERVLERNQPSTEINRTERWR